MSRTIASVGLALVVVIFSALMLVEVSRPATSSASLKWLYAALVIASCLTLFIKELYLDYRDRALKE